jgi:UDP-N-acetylmuramyl pentapeptide phosphotransferase/UDP-N-acetylglucosamine-1-phosphate transferase
MQALAFANHLLFGIALFAFSIVLTWGMLRIGIMSMPNRRSSHETPVPNGGGVAIVLTFFVGFAVFYALSDEVRPSDFHLAGFAAGAVCIAVISLLDDLGHLRTFAYKLMAQLLAALLLVSFDIVFRRFSVPLVGNVDVGWWGYPLTVLWVVAMTNIFNFMDGLDGLAGGCGAIVALFFGIATYVEGSLFVYIFSYVLFASALGFLVFNFPKARIFMGDVGSQFLGFCFAAIAVIAAEYDLSRTSALVMPLLFFNFIFDTGLTFLRRLAMGQNVTEAHRSHLYQLMNRMGASHFQVSLFHFAVTAAQGVGVLVLIELPAESRAWVFVPFILFQIVYAAIVLRRAARRNLLGAH